MGLTEEYSNAIPGRRSRDKSGWCVQTLLARDEKQIPRPAGLGMTPFRMDGISSIEERF